MTIDDAHYSGTLSTLYCTPLIISISTSLATMGHKGRHDSPSGPRLVMKIVQRPIREIFQTVKFDLKLVEGIESRQAKLFLSKL